MAIELKEIINVDTATIKDVRDKISELREEISRLRLANGDYREEAQKVNVLQDHLNKVMTASKRYTADAEGSFNALNKELRRLKEAWKAAGDEATRNKIGEKVNEVKAKLNGMNESIGNFQHNVGNYTKRIVDAFNQMGGAVGGMGGKVVSAAGAVKGLWKTLSTNPIGIVVAALGGLTAAFAAVTRAVQDNEESQNRLHIAMSAFQPMKDQMTRWLDSMGVAFTVMATDIGEAVRQTREMIAAWKDWMGITSGEAARVKEENENYRKIAEGEVALQKLRRTNRKENAKDTATIERLREEAAETKNVTEKAQKLNEAKEIQARVNERNTKEAKLNLAILKAHAATTPNSVKANDELAEAEARVSETMAQGDRTMRSLTRELNRYEKAAGGAKKATDELATEALRLAGAEINEGMKSVNDAMDEWDKGLEKVMKMQAELQEGQLSELELEEKRYQEKLALFEQYGIDTELLEEAHQEKMAEIRAEATKKEYAEMERVKAEQEAKDLKAKKDYEKLMKARETATKNMASGTSGILKNLSTAMGESTRLGKGFAIAAATIDTIASAVTGFRAGMNQWADAGPMAWMGPVQAALNATMALTAGFAEVQKIQSVDTSGNASAGGGASATALAIPNIEGLSSPVDYTRQVTTETEQEEMNKNNRVYILESDIQESGKRVKVREEETTF